MKINTDKKNQHYIPKFYLKNFSFEDDKKQIGIYNIKSDFYFQKAKLKTQGSKNFFYGHDGKIEDSLSDIEGSLASEIREIIEKKDVPVKESINHLTLLTFVGLTHLRNPVMIDFIKNSRVEMRKRLIELDEDVDTEKFVPGITHDYAIKLALSGLPSIIDNLVDLDYKLLINQTSIPFIASDFPVVKYNQFLEKKKWQHGKTGYGNTGLQIFIPLNPKITIVFFDSMIYKIGFKKRKTYEITEKKDIEQLNILQVLNSFTTLFFNEKMTKHNIDKLITKANKYKKANLPLSELSHIVKDTGNDKNIIDFKKDKKNLVVMGSTDCEINLEINGLKTHSNSKKIKITNSMAQMRPATMKIRKNSR